MARDVSTDLRTVLSRSPQATPPPGLPPPGLPLPLNHRTTSGASTASTSNSILPIYSTPSSPPTTPGAATSAPLDRYADVFVQGWLRLVNRMPPHQILHQLPPTVDFTVLHDGLFPRALLNFETQREIVHRRRIESNVVQIEQPNALFQLNEPLSGSARIIPQRPETGPKSVRPRTTREKLDSLPPLTPKTYGQRSIPIQQAEMNARISQLESANLFETILGRPAAGDAFNSFRLVAKSIREGWPPVDLGDQLYLRQLYPETQNWQGIIFEAVVQGINRAEGWLTIRCDALPQFAQSMVFNVQWRVQDRVFFQWRKATEALDYELNIHLDPSVPPLPPMAGKTVAETWLFPSSDDITRAPPNIEHLTHIATLDPTLNAEQRRAVEAICWGQHKVPFIISGPPGTGKTKTLVEAILQILQKHPFTHILVCGASNPSADTLLKRLASKLAPRDLLRLNAPSRPFTEVSNVILPFCYVENDLFSLPNLGLLMSKRVIVTTCLDASLLHDARCTNKLLGQLESHVFRTIHPLAPLQCPPPHFGYLLVDEGAQATEPDVSCALAVVVSNHASSLRAHVTLCGDSKQLGPAIVGEDARALDLDVSLLERLSDRGLYRDHPLARKNRRNNLGARWDVACPFVDLTKNYRSATPILMLPSTLLYHDTLEPYAPFATQTSLLHKWNQLPTQGFPIIFHGLDGSDEPVDEGASFYNDDEVEWVVGVVADLLDRKHTTRHGLLLANEISVISPYREQVWRIRTRLRQLGHGGVDVGNVEALQGAENRVVIISAVRANERWLKLDRSQSRGLINEPKRWNVAMTRAKELLIVVGNVRLLALDQHWLAFYRFCQRNGCYTGMPVIDASPTGAAEGISRLEEQWRAGAGPGGEEAAFDVLVGSMARETLGDDDDDERVILRI